MGITKKVLLEKADKDQLRDGEYLCPKCGTDMRHFVEQKKGAWEFFEEVVPFFCDECKKLLILTEEIPSGRLILELYEQEESYMMIEEDDCDEEEMNVLGILLKATCNQCKHRDYCDGESYECPAYNTVYKILTDLLKKGVHKNGVD